MAFLLFKKNVNPKHYQAVMTGPRKSEQTRESRIEEGGGCGDTGERGGWPQSLACPTRAKPSAAFPSVARCLPKKHRSWMSILESIAVARLFYFHQSIH